MQIVDRHSDAFVFPINLLECARLPDPKCAPLISPQKLSKHRIFVSWLASKSSLQPSPYHRQTAQHIRLPVQSIDRARDNEQKSGAHEILAISVTHAPCVDAHLAGALGAKVDET